MARTSPTGDALVPFLEPEANHQPVLAAIQDAKKTIRMEMYLLTDSNVIDALKRAQSRGVDVRVLVENEPEGVGTGNRPAISELSAATVAVRAGNTLNNQTHAKFMVVDERVSLVMSFDHTRESFAINRGFGLIDDDALDVAELTKLFDADWTGSSFETSSSSLVLGPGDSRKRLSEFIDSATRTLDMEVDAMRDDDIEKHIVSAIGRGTTVRLIVSPSESGPDPNSEGYRRLSSAGAKIRQLKFPGIQTHMMVADGSRGYIGSHEFSNASLDSNRELGVIVTAKRVVDGLQGTFVADWDIAK